MKGSPDPFLPTALMCLIAVWKPSIAWAHCDTLSGPVIKDAKLALQKNDVTPVLKWISEEDEKEIRPLFQKTLTVRTKTQRISQTCISLRPLSGSIVQEKAPLYGIEGDGISRTRH